MNIPFIIVGSLILAIATLAWGFGKTTEENARWVSASSLLAIAFYVGALVVK
jgi:hypothetical protein